MAWHAENMFLPLPSAYSEPGRFQKSSAEPRSAEKRLLGIWVVMLEWPGAGAVVSRGVPPVPLAVGCYRVYSLKMVALPLHWSTLTRKSEWCAGGCAGEYHPGSDFVQPGTARA